jgi:sarcosine oxidase subunit alpha
MSLKLFGVEAQRILRLEKGHPIIGVDTDALSNPLDAGMGALVRFDKPMFHGRNTLLRLREMRPSSRLVGFFPTEAHVAPEEGCQVVVDGAPVGRVTSIRFSPTLNRVIGLAWVPAARSRPDHRFELRFGGGDVPAVVAELPFYDASGKRLKS